MRPNEIGEIIIFGVDSCRMLGDRCRFAVVDVMALLIGADWGGCTWCSICIFVDLY